MKWTESRNRITDISIERSQNKQRFITVPTVGVIVDMHPVFEYIEGSDILRILAEDAGYHKFVGQTCWCSFESSTDMDCLKFYNACQSKLTGLGISPKLLNNNLIWLENFRNDYIKSLVVQSVWRKLSDCGYQVKKWIAPGTAIIEDTGSSVLSNTRRAYRRLQTFETGSSLNSELWDKK